jgi:peptidoglycan/LPS O-acetylase OafA/YrhL
VATSVTSLERRPAIDGLRGIAILMVVAFHARVPGFGGGFAGVDVFFVISGYLITRLLLRELDTTGRISFSGFYARRARRLLPALGALLVTMAVVVWPLLPAAYERRGLATSIVFASLFSANLLFYHRAQDYFADSSRPDPLTHTWSLSVEEQFYLVWPALLLLAARLARPLRARWLPLAFIVLIGVASFASAVISRSNPDWVFYSPTSRMWELALGAALGYALERNVIRAEVSGLVAVVGTCAIVSSALVIDSSAPRNVWHLLLPTLGTVGVILSIEKAAITPVPRALGHPVLEGIGRVSYGWYLWHFPALVLLGGSFGAPWTPWLAVAGSFAVAALSYRYIEEPIRRRRYAFAVYDRPVLAGAAVLLLGLASGGSALRYRASNSPEMFRGERSDVAWALARCPRLSRHDVVKGDICSLGASDSTAPRIVAIGDSHAPRFGALLDEFGKRAGVQVSIAWASGCAPLLTLTSPFQRNPAQCRKQVDSILGTIHGNGVHPVSGVALIARWSVVFGTPPRDPMAQPDFYLLLGRTPSLMIAKRADSALRETTKFLTARGVRTLLVGQAPEWSGNPFGCDSQPGHACIADRRLIKAHQARSIMSLRSVASTDASVRLLELDRFFCGRETCSPFRRGIRAFDDPHHLSINGARSLAGDVWSDLTWLAALDNRAPSGQHASTSSDEFARRQE